MNKIFTLSYLGEETYSSSKEQDSTVITYSIVLIADYL